MCVDVAHACALGAVPLECKCKHLMLCLGAAAAASTSHVHGAGEWWAVSGAAKEHPERLDGWLEVSDGHRRCHLITISPDPGKIVVLPICDNA